MTSAPQLGDPYPDFSFIEMDVNSDGYAEVRFVCADGAIRILSTRAQPGQTRIKIPAALAIGEEWETAPNAIGPWSLVQRGAKIDRYVRKLFRTPERLHVYPATRVEEARVDDRAVTFRRR